MIMINQRARAAMVSAIAGLVLGACAFDPVDVATAPIERLKKKVVTNEVNPHIAQRMAEAKDLKDWINWLSGYHRCTA